MNAPTMARADRPAVGQAWLCLCGTVCRVDVSRVVPDHLTDRGHWCAVSCCTLTPRALGRAA